MTPGPDLQQLIDTIREDAGTDDVLDQLGTAASTISELTSTSDAALGYFVDRARGAGKSWVEISAVLGVSKQAAHKRFADSWTAAAVLERYTPRTKAVLAAAKEVARGLNHPFLGTEHLLLAIFSQPEALATRVLVAHGITEEAVAAAVAPLSPAKGASKDVEAALSAENPPYTRKAAHVLQGAVAEALVLGHNYVGTEHLLLAFYRDSASVATEVLTSLGLDESAAKTSIQAVLEELTKAR
ncbi:Clp protease N-terminal domain-containing protein [Streptomyces sp. SID13031]|uniref:Clp protease N-terminal domain-containing protein n=1 Tax=Streptomyces sp. SID13031 TaxID=2706046 RepID=UPI0013C828B9|nr:Clp protease N-terminal domain-containing protein [Streptomyces sp. SID13031]NEA37190.1 ATP-dependent Clp protease ATP-binding subunit [Streptomyces sp. SID13031]